MTLSAIIAGIGWEPEIRGLLAFLLGVTVLCGSVYLLLATNLATRLGFQVALTGLMGWMIVLGAIWWMYGIGLQGDTPEWRVKEVNFGDLDAAATDRVSDIDITVLPPHEELNALEPAEFDEVRDRVEPELAGWRLLPETDPSFGEAMAVVDEYLATGVASAIGVDAVGDYIPTYSFERGGKAELPRDPNRFDRVANWFYTTFVQLRHPTRYAVMQVAPTLPESRPAAAEPGQAPPTLEADPDMPMISVVLQRDLGQERVPAALITLGSLAIFGVLCFMLHRRDQLVAKHRAMVPATTG